MFDISISEQMNTGELRLEAMLDWLKDSESLRLCIFQVDVKDRLGGGTLVYQWRTGGSTKFPNSVLDFDDNASRLSLFASSSEMRTNFSPVIIAACGGRFHYEIGYFRPDDLDNMVSIGVGAFPVVNGVIY